MNISTKQKMCCEKWTSVSMNEKLKILSSCKEDYKYLL